MKVKVPSGLATVSEESVVSEVTWTALPAWWANFSAVSGSATASGTLASERVIPSYTQ